MKQILELLTVRVKQSFYFGLYSMKHLCSRLIALTSFLSMASWAALKPPLSPKVDPHIVAFFDEAYKDSIVRDFFDNAYRQQVCQNTLEELQIFFAVSNPQEKPKKN